MCSISKDLFEQEQQFLDRALSRIENAAENNSFSREEYAAVIKEYSGVLKQLRRMTKMTDRVTKDINLAQMAADDANRAKSNFLANMSHEIRTPINAVLGMSEMILREARTPEILEYAGNIQNASKTLLSIVNDILDLSKIESGKMDIIPVEYEIVSTLHDLVNMISFKAANKGLELKLNIAEDIPSVLIGDEIRIKQVVTNILTNAVKYTHQGSVTLGLQWEQTGDDMLDLIFSVKDTGIGIKEEDMGKLFASFERIEEKRNRNIEGTGLGMSIVLQLLALMESELNVSSVYGEGSEFSFRIAQGICDATPAGNFLEMYESALKERGKSSARFTAPKAKILIVDDNEMNLKVACGLLKRTKIQIVTAVSGMQCLELIRDNRFDIIFTDHMMPIMDGIETLHAMREQEQNLCREAPVVIFTANAISGAREMFLSEGFDDYLSKPIDPKEFELMLMRLLPPALIESEEEAAEEEEAETSELPAIEGIDIDEAALRSGGADMVFKMFHDFYITMPGKIELIERYLAARQLKDYTIEVHSLKSAARIIGATALSAQAEELEHCGNNGDIEQMRAKTPALLEAFRRIGENIAPYAGLDEIAEEDKAEISDDDLLGLILDMHERMEVFDIDALDEQIKRLEGCKLPPAFAGIFEKIKVCAVNVDMDGGKALLDEILESLQI